MNKKPTISFNEFIKIDRRKKEAIYLQIVFQFINAVQRNILIVGEKIPGTRVISKDLKVNRNTLVSAFEELETLGWLEIRPNVGSFVKNPQKVKGKRREEISDKFKPPKEAVFKFHRSFILDSPFEESKCRLKFNDGQPDYRLSKNKELARFYSASINRKKVAQELSVLSVKGNTFFKEQLCYYLNISRGFHIYPDYLSVGKSKELLLFILTQLLISKGDIVLVPSFGYFFSNMVFQQAGAQIKSVPVDEKGLDVEYIRKHYKKGDIRCIYVNSNFHYPTNVPFDRTRKSALLELSEEYDFVIIEDDNDFDFQYEPRPSIPIASKSNNGRILYLGSFGKFLIPAFQTEFLIAPVDLIEEVEKYLGFMNPQGDILKEQALAEMIKEGDIHRYLWKSIQIYKKRKESFKKLLSNAFKDEINFTDLSGGLAYWIEFNQRFSLNQFVKECSERDLFIPRVCMYQNSEITALRLGFAHFNEEEMEEAIQVLRIAYDKVIKQT